MSGRQECQVSSGLSRLHVAIGCSQAGADFEGLAVRCQTDVLLRPW